MTKKKTKRRPVRYEIRPIHRWLKIALIMFIIIGIVATITLYFTIQASKARYEAARKEAAGLEQDNQQLEQINDAKGTTWWIEQIAKDLWDWVRPGSKDLNVDYS